MKGRRTFTRGELTQIKDLIRYKAGVGPDAQKRVRRQIRRLGFYITDFGAISSPQDVDRLVASGQIIVAEAVGGPSRRTARVDTQEESDEDYIIDLCDEILGLCALRQHRFPFLRGDPGKSGTSVTLPVDAYYPSLKLVIEYRERQHTESVRHFDKPYRMTVSGVHRGEQRKLYDQRRREVLPQQGIALVELSCLEFAYDHRKRLLRRRPQDLAVIRDRLSRHAR